MTALHVICAPVSDETIVVVAVVVVGCRDIEDNLLTELPPGFLSMASYLKVLCAPYIITLIRFDSRVPIAIIVARERVRNSGLSCRVPPSHALHNETNRSIL